MSSCVINQLGNYFVQLVWKMEAAISQNPQRRFQIDIPEQTKY